MSHTDPWKIISCAPAPEDAKFAPSKKLCFPGLRYGGRSLRFANSAIQLIKITH